MGHIWRPPQGSKVTSDTPDLTLFSTGTFRFAYGRSDVVLMCFDIGRAQSLENCRWFWKTRLRRSFPIFLFICFRTMWYQQIRKFCPQVKYKDIFTLSSNVSLMLIGKDHFFRPQSSWWAARMIHGSFTRTISI